MAGPSSSEKLRIGFDSNNYGSWGEKMKRRIEAEKLLGFIDGPPLVEADEGYEDWKTTNDMVRGWILGELSDELVPECGKFVTARDIWINLEQRNRFYGIPTPPDDQEIVQRPYLQLYQYARRARSDEDWAAARAILNQYRNGVSARLSSFSNTVLHVAVDTRRAVDFVQNLVNYDGPGDSLKAKNSKGLNPLHSAAAVGNTAAARILVARLPNLLFEETNEKGRFPIHVAADFAHRDTLQFLMEQTNEYLRENANYRNINPYDGDSGVSLVCFVIDADFYDLAEQLVNSYPHMARTKHSQSSISALEKISLKKHAFASGADSTNMQMHQQAIQLLRCLCRHMEYLGQSAVSIYCDAMITAARLGIREVVEEIVETFPTALYCRNGEGQYFFQVAAVNRCEKVFDLIYQTRDNRHIYSYVKDSNGNTILHLAARLAPLHKLNLVSGAALQMRSELKWFEAAQNFVHPHAKNLKNNEGKTAKMAFTEEHKDLKVEGEKWLKDTANSCIIVAALIATVVFASAVTVPGGNDSKGYPIKGKVAFIIFSISDSISLFTSVISLLIFVSILTSRYTENDFLLNLPWKLLAGLITLFFSILFLMVAFSATIFLVFGQENKWVLIPVVALAFLTVLAFIILQHKLLSQVLVSLWRPLKEFLVSLCCLSIGKPSHAPFY